MAAGEIYSKTIRIVSLLVNFPVLALDWLLASNPRDGSVSSGRYAGWMLLNIAILAIGMASVKSPWIPWAAGLFIMAHASLLLAAALIFREESNYWDGLIEKRQCVFVNPSAARNALVLLLSSIFMLVCASILLHHLDQFSSERRLSIKPSLNCHSSVCGTVEYLIVCLHHMPFFAGVMRHLLGWLWGFQYQVEWLPGVPLFRVLLYLAAGTWLYGTVRILVLQRFDVGALCDSMEAAKEPRLVTYLQMRLARAPGFAKRRIVSEAVSNTDPIARRRYITAAHFSGVLTFPQTFVFHLSEQNEANKKYGLHRCHTLLTENIERIDDGIRRSFISNAMYQIKSGSHAPRIVEALWGISILLLQTASKGPTQNALRHKMIETATHPIMNQEVYETNQCVLLRKALKDIPEETLHQFMHHFSLHSIPVQLCALRAATKLTEEGYRFDRSRIEFAATKVREAWLPLRGGELNAELAKLYSKISK